MLDLSRKAVRHLASYTTKNHTSLPPNLIHLPIYQQHPPYPPLPPSLPPSLSFPNPTHPFIHLPNPIHPSIRPIKPQSRSAGGFSHHLFFFFFRKEGIDRSCGMLACVCVSFFLFFLGGGGSLFLCLVLSCRRYVTLRYGTVNRREVGLEWVGEWLGV